MPFKKIAQGVILSVLVISDVIQNVERLREPQLLPKLPSLKSITFFLGASKKHHFC